VTEKIPTGGYSYAVTEVQIVEWMGVPVEEKLRWIEDVNRLSHELQSDETKRIRELIRSGSI
jgi:hypothetical protein